MDMWDCVCVDLPCTRACTSHGSVSPFHYRPITTLPCPLFLLSLPSLFLPCQVVEAYRQQGFPLLLSAFNRPKFLEDLTGLTALRESVNDAVVDWEEEEEQLEGGWVGREGGEGGKEEGEVGEDGRQGGEVWRGGIEGEQEGQETG